MAFARSSRECLLNASRFASQIKRKSSETCRWIGRGRKGTLWLMRDKRMREHVRERKSDREGQMCSESIYVCGDAHS